MTEASEPRRAGLRDVHGILPLDKPAGVTSNRALQQVKRLYRARKAGHTGSLDPLATGLLPVCFGEATKVASYLFDADKTYRVTALLGVATDTGDADGSVIERRDGTPPSSAAVASAAARFVGEIEQVPPMYSALKHGGRRLYELARRGVEVERAARRVRVAALDVTRYEWPELAFTVRCSKGTYVRSLVIDIAAELGTVGHVAALRRTAVGPFTEADMVSMGVLEELAAAGEPALDGALVAIDRALAEWPSVTLPDRAAERFRHGQALPAEPGWPAGLVRVYAHGALCAVAEVTADRKLAPRRMFVP